MPGASALSPVAGRQASGHDSTIPYDLRFFQWLDRIVQIEPWLTRDKIMIDVLKPITIEKGKPFNPDANTREVLNAASRESAAQTGADHGDVLPEAGCLLGRWARARGLLCL